LAEPVAQRVPTGSYAVLGPDGLMHGVREFTLALRVMPTLTLPRRQVLWSCLDAQGRGVELELTAERRLRASIGTADGIMTLEGASAIAQDA
jgi:hypothetical protein